MRKLYYTIRKNSFLGLFALLVMLIGMRTNVNATQHQAPDIEHIDTFINEQMQHHKLPGLALALVEGDRVIFMKGYGKADQTGRPVTPETSFLLASVSKPLTATAIMQLVEQGQVELDAPVQRYVPDFRVADPAASAKITVRHLLLHTSGIPVTACDTRIDASTLAEYVAELQTVNLDAPPGTRHRYCSGNYNVLGRIIENVSGQSFGQYMQQHVFMPLEMRQSFTSEAEAQRASMAQGYQWVFGLLVPTQHRFNPSQLPSGYMISSAEDMSHFLIAHLNEGRYASKNLLSASSTAAMQMPGTNRGGQGSYGFGWVISPKGGVPAVWHDGVNANFHTLLLMQPETRRGAVLLMNSFGIVPSLSAYQEIEEGVARLLAGLQPAPAEIRLGSLYFIIDALFALSLVIAVWPLAHIQRWYRRLFALQQAGRLALGRAFLRVGWEIGFALVFIITVRLVIITGLGAQSWYEVFTVFPDFVMWIWALTLIGLFTGFARLILIFKTRRAYLRGGGAIAEQTLSDSILRTAEK